MIDRRLVGGGFVGGILLGIAVLNITPVTDFMRGFLGMPRRVDDPANKMPASRPVPMADINASPNAGVAGPGDPAATQQFSNLSFEQILALSQIARRFGGASPIDEIQSGQVQPQSGAYPSLALLQSEGRSSSTELPNPAGQVEPAFGANSQPDFDSAATTQPNTGAIDVRTGQFLAPAGPAGYVDPRDGTFYAPSGTDGVVNTRTGEYSPISH